ncbi:hypothetical protein [Neisseria canis]|uniref:Uncharacterized protein n=1 Tax=Neisseria canis TaxID=493 RepID=A0A448D662_9NEIS|nr:hypothetical protein [Neisseria canis]OSI11922.1 hypothetical protein BWD07_08030 [Neisseria canis]VEE99750.1 Uncharacterised protein [Neisseria canis]
MTWPIPEIPDVVKPASKSNVGLWFVGLIVLYLIAAPFIWKLWSNENRSLLWLLIGFPLLLWLLSLFVVFIWKMNQDSQFKAWEQEKDNIRQRWILWAQKKLALVDSSFHLPTTFDTARILIPNSIDNKGHIYTFSTDLDSDDHISTIYTKCLKEIINFLHKVQNNKINIYVEAEDEDTYQKHIEYLEASLNSMNIQSSLKPQLCQTGIQLDLIDHWFENTIEGLNIIFSVAHNHDDQFSEFTEHISWVALTSTEWAKQNKLPIQAFIQRPIDIDISDKQLLGVASKQFKGYGLVGKEIEVFWSVGISQNEAIQLNTAIFKSGINLSYEKKQAAILNIDACIGTPSVNMACLALALATYNLNQQHQLLFAWPNKNGLVNLSLLYTSETHLSS